MKYLTMNVVQAVRKFMDAQEYSGFAIHCPQKEQAEALLSALHSLGRHWSETEPIISADGTIKLNWYYGKKTCYRFFIDTFELYSAQQSFYEKKKFFIYTFDELMSQYGTNEEPQSETNQQNTDTADVALQPKKNNKLDENTKPENSSDSLPDVPAADVPVPTQEAPVSEEQTDRNTSVDTEKYSQFLLLQFLNLRVNEPFFIKCDKILLFYPKTLYRFNGNGARECLVDVENGVWVPCNEEKELNYLINHPKIIQKADGYNGTN